MTFQVALLGSDGFLIASDRKITTDEPCDGGRTGSSGTKIFAHEGATISYACACSRSGLSFQVKDKVFERLATDGESLFSADDPCLGLKGIGRSVWTAYHGEPVLPGVSQASATLLHAVWGKGKARLWRLIVAGDPTCMEILDKAIGGDSANSSLFFTEEYYQPNRPVDELVFLATHTVIMAGRRNPEFVQGLEIVKCKEGKLSRLSEDEIGALKNRSAELDDKIRAALSEKRGSV